jgi:hypothetical protein
MKDSQPFAKLKEVFCQPSNRHKNTTFNFARPHQKPTHHPTSGLLTIWKWFWSIKELKIVNCRLKNKRDKNAF